MTDIRLASGTQDETTEAARCAIHNKFHRLTKDRPTDRQSIASLLSIQLTRRAPSVPMSITIVCATTRIGIPLAVGLLTGMTHDTLRGLGRMSEARIGTNTDLPPSNGGRVIQKITRDTSWRSSMVASEFARHNVIYQNVSLIPAERDRPIFDSLMHPWLWNDQRTRDTNFPNDRTLKARELTPLCRARCSY